MSRRRKTINPVEIAMKMLVGLMKASLKAASAPPRRAGKRGL